MRAIASVKTFFEQRCMTILVEKSITSIAFRLREERKEGVTIHLLRKD